MGFDEVYMVLCDGNPVERALSRRAADRYCEQMQSHADYSHGTKIRNSEFRVVKDTQCLKTDDALYKEFRRRTMVVRP